jgi:hypothetical protein
MATIYYKQSTEPFAPAAQQQLIVGEVVTSPPPPKRRRQIIVSQAASMAALAATPNSLPIEEQLSRRIVTRRPMIENGLPFAPAAPAQAVVFSELATAPPPRPRQRQIIASRVGGLVILPADFLLDEKPIYPRQLAKPRQLETLLVVPTIIPVAGLVNGWELVTGKPARQPAPAKPDSALVLNRLTVPLINGWELVNGWDAEPFGQRRRLLGRRPEEAHVLRPVVSAPAEPGQWPAGGLVERGGHVGLLARGGQIGILERGGHVGLVKN